MPGMYATIGEILSYEGEVGNICDTFAVAIKKDGKVVAHSPNKNFNSMLNFYKT